MNQVWTKTFVFLLLALSVVSSFGQVYVSGCHKKNGTFVQPHYRSNPDGNSYNNWSTKGNMNPYTGKVGTKNPALLPTSNCGYTGSLSQPIPTSPASNIGTTSSSSYQTHPVQGGSYSTIIPIDLSGGAKPMPDQHLPSATDNTDYTPHYTDETLPSLSSAPNSTVVHRKSGSGTRVRRKATFPAK